MIGVYDFCGHYEWTFEWLRESGGQALVEDYWVEAISHDSQRHARNLIIPHGIEGMKQYWSPTLEEEGGECVISHHDNVIRLDMHHCPSKGFLMRNNLQQFSDYCDHCIGWIGPVMQEAGFRIDHQHNHCGQCWWEMRPVEDTRPFSQPGELVKTVDIRLSPNWPTNTKPDSFLHDPHPQSQSLASAAKGTYQPMKPYFCTAIVTPLKEDDSLHLEGLENLISQQFDAGIDSLLLGGTMGAMQLLSNQTYRDLMTESVRLANGRGELLGGAGDASFARTCERIEFLNTLPLDGVVVLPPYVMQFSQSELVDYYTSLADMSRAPILLYDLPVLTRSKIALDTVLQVASHPNISGIKCSDEPGYARQVRDLTDDAFRVILAAPTLMDVFLRDGFQEHLDGIYCLFPSQLQELGAAVVAGDYGRARELQQGINSVLRLVIKSEVWRPCTVLLHELGIPGRFKPRPHRDWDAAETESFLQADDTQAVLQFLRSGRPTMANA